MKKNKKQIINNIFIIFSHNLINIFFVIINLSLILILNLINIKAYDIYTNKVVIPDKIISKPIKINDENIICFFKNHIEIFDNDLNSIVNVSIKADKVFDSFKIQNYKIIPFLSNNLLNLFIIDENLTNNKLTNYKIQTVGNFNNLKSVIFNSKNDFTKELITYFDNKINTFYINLNLYNIDNIYINIKNKSEKEVGDFKQIKKIYNYFYTYDKYEKLIIFNNDFEVIGKYNLGKAGSELHESKDNKFVLASDKGFYIIYSTDFKIISKQDFSSYPLKLIKINDTQFITITNNYNLISFNLDNNNIISNKVDLFLFEPNDFINVFYHDGILLNLYDYYNPYAFISTGYTDINLDKNTATIQYIDYDINNQDINNQNLVLTLSGSTYLNINRTQFIKDKNTKKYKSIYNYNTYQFKISPFYIININPLSIIYYKLLQSLPLNYYASVNIPKDKYYNSFYDTYYFNTFYSLFSYVLVIKNNLYWFTNYPKHTVIFKL